MQIYPDSPNFFQSSEEIAARKIQAGFRGYRVRKQLKSKTNTKNSYINNNNNNNRNSNCNINNNNIKLNKKMNGNISKETGTTTRVTMDTFQRDNNDHHYNNHNELSSQTSSLPITGTVAVASVEDKSATKIQAGIRGYLVRKRQKREQEAATKIQANFRGFKVRKELQKNQKIK